jgi:hypothetical protein
MDIKKFTIKDKVYSVKPLNLFQLSKIRQDVVEDLRASFKRDVLDYSISVPEKERSKFIFDALKSKPYTDEDITNAMQTNKGIVSIISACLNESISIIEQLILTESDVLLEVFNFAMQIEEPKVEDDEKKASTPMLAMLKQ